MNEWNYFKTMILIDWRCNQGLFIPYIAVLFPFVGKTGIKTTGQQKTTDRATERPSQKKADLRDSVKVSLTRWIKATLKGKQMDKKITQFARYFFTNPDVLV